MDSISKDKLIVLINGCLEKDRNSQRLLYNHYFSLGMSIALRYSNSREEAIEILNDSFIKVFNKLSTYNIEKSFNGWLRRIVINTALDSYRKNKKHYHHFQLEDNLVTYQENFEEIKYDEILKLVQQLSPTYKAIFNLYVIDGHSHEEIAEMMEISVGASKSGLSRARANLRKLLKRVYQIDYARSSR